MFCLSHSQHCPPFPFHDLSQSQHCPPFPFHDLSHHNTVHLSHFMTCHSHNTVHLSHFMTCHSHYTVHLSHFMTCHRILNKRNMTGATSGTITTYHFRSLEYTPVFFCEVHVAQSLVLCGMFWGSLFIFYSLSALNHCIVCPFSIYGLWLLLWYLQTFRPLVVATNPSFVLRSWLVTEYDFITRCFCMGYMPGSTSGERIC